MYEYMPLPSSDNKPMVRLLSILPGSLEELIRVEINVSELDSASAPAYEALSYIWGSQEHRASVEIVSPGYPPSHLTVTRNLELALRYLRLPDGPRRVWVDAICIDQTNLAERSSQVAIMGDIFKVASRVVVWLGPEDETSDEACDLLQNLAEEIVSNGTPCTVRPKPGSKITAEQIHRSGWSPFDARQSEAVHSLLCRPWFERVWIRQEIGLSSPATIVMCGWKVIPWAQFKEAMLMICLKGCSLPLNREKKYHFGLRCENVLFPLATCSFRRTFSEIRRYISAAQCADDRDRLYGVLSLLWHEDRQNITPDYGKSVREVYMNATVGSIANRNLDILRFCVVGNRSSNLNIPSWTLDLTLSPSCVEIENHGTHCWASIHESPPFLLGVTGETLRVYGVSGASVSRSIYIFQSEGQTADARAASMISNILSVFPDDFRSASYLNGQGLLEALCVTLASNRLFREEYGPADALQALVGSQAVPGFYDKVQTAMSRVFSGEHCQGDLDIASDRQLLWHTFWMTAADRVLFTTEEGYIGLAPNAVAAGDQVFTVLGCTTPLLFRPLGDGRFRLIGDCYCHGLMHSEALLGPIPPDACLLSTIDEGYYKSWFVSAAGEKLETDPRISALLDKMEGDEEFTASTEADLRKMSGEEKVKALEKHGGVHLESLTIA